MGRTYHCDACDETVDGYEVSIGRFTEVRCIFCGLPLEKRDRSAAQCFRRALVADDSAFFTKGLESFLQSRHLAGEILTAADGASAVEMAARALKERRGVNLAVLDLMMPRLSGLHAAVAIRAVERAFGAPGCAVVFLSSRRIDEGFRPLLEELKPAYYVNKEAGEGGLLGDRLETILRAVSTSLDGEGRRIERP